MQGWHILHGMHGNIDIAGQQRLFNLAGEQALAADFFQRAIDDLIAGHFNDYDGKCLEWQIKSDRQTLTGFIGLSHCEGRSSGSDLERGGGCGQIQHHVSTVSPANLA